MNYIYIGSNNRKLGLVRYTIYTDKPRFLIDTLKTSCDLIENLFVPVRDFNSIEKELSKRESLISKASRQIEGVK